MNILTLIVFSILLLEFAECNVIMQFYAFVGTGIQLRCNINDTSKFTRITHTSFNGDVETLLSNDYLNRAFTRSEIHIEKKGRVYFINIDPVMSHSAGVYTCEGDVSQSNPGGNYLATTPNPNGNYVPYLSNLASFTLNVIDYEHRPTLLENDYIYPFLYPTSLVPGYWKIPRKRNQTNDDYKDRTNKDEIDLTDYTNTRKK